MRSFSMKSEIFLHFQTNSWNNYENTDAIVLRHIDGEAQSPPAQQNIYDHLATHFQSFLDVFWVFMSA